MSQILHIFLKDTRRFWAEISLSVAITAAFAWIYPQQWLSADHIQGAMGNRGVVGYQIQIIGGFLFVFVPISWGLLIVRSVHAESLVGDRQFWLTRPYEWPKLLAAKLLFLFTFLYIPIFLAQSAMLAETGFAPTSYIPRLLYNLLLLTIVIVLPIFALATVTSNFGRLILTLLGAFLGIILLGSIVDHLLPSPFTGVSGTHDGTFTIAFLLCAVVVVLQYVLRRVALSRVLLFGIPALLILGSPLSARYEQLHHRIDIQYPTPSTPLVQLAYHPLDPGTQSFESYTDNGNVIIHTPLQGTGVAPGTVLIPDAVKLEVDAPNGFHWTSDWQPSSTPKFYADSEFGDAPVSMPRSIYEQLKTAPLTLRLTLALTQARQTSVQRIALPFEDFSVPGFGVCSPVDGFRFPLGPAGGLSCRSALRDPPLTYVSVIWSDTPCTKPQPVPDQGVLGADWVGSLDRAPADLNISSVQPVHFSITNSFKDQRSEQPRFLCPGSPVTFTEYERVSRTQTSLTIHDFHLPGITVSNGETHVFSTTTTTTAIPEQK
ncbi:MAG: hypothetical protein ABR923_20125 [Terracidiphilus sp.]|jgi:hypothetical protein